MRTVFHASSKQNTDHVVLYLGTRCEKPIAKTSQKLYDTSKDSYQYWYHKIIILRLAEKWNPTLGIRRTLTHLTIPSVEGLNLRHLAIFFSLVNYMYSIVKAIINSVSTCNWFISDDKNSLLKAHVNSKLKITPTGIFQTTLSVCWFSITLYKRVFTICWVLLEVSIYLT